MSEFQEADAYKLRMLVRLFDKRDAEKGVFNEREVQEDLERIAKVVEEQIGLHKPAYKVAYTTEQPLKTASATPPAKVGWPRSLLFTLVLLLISDAVTSQSPLSPTRQAAHFMTSATIVRIFTVVLTGPNDEPLALRDSLGTWTVPCPELALETMFKANQQFNQQLGNQLMEQAAEIRDLKLQLLEHTSRELHISGVEVSAEDYIALR